MPLQNKSLLKRTIKVKRVRVLVQWVAHLVSSGSLRYRNIFSQSEHNSALEAWGLAYSG